MLNLSEHIYLQLYRLKDTSVLFYVAPHALGTFVSKFIFDILSYNTYY